MIQEAIVKLTRKEDLTRNEMQRTMAQIMKGDIFIESIERVGSRFFVVFPLSDKKI